MTQRDKIKLSTVQVQTLTAMQDDIDWVESEIIRAQRAELDVSGMETKLNTLKSIRAGLLREYT
jgi:hypothetical protein